MAGLEADTSSYNQPLPVSPLELTGKIGALQQQKLAIDQAKLDQANQGLTYLTRAMASIGPNPGPDWKQKYMEVGANAVKMGLVPAEQLRVWQERVNQASDPQTFFNQTISAAQSHQQILQNYQGTPATTESGAVRYQGMQGGAFAPGFRPATQLPVQPPPGTPYYEGGQARTLGPSGPEGIAPAASAAPPASPAASASTAPMVPRRVPTLPVERPVSGPTGPTREITDQVPTTLQNRMAAGFNAAPPPMFEEGKKTLAEAQLKASGLSMANKPAIQALDVLKNVKLATGPGTAQINDLMAGLKAFGIVDTKLENDPTAARQELEKKLAQFVGNSPIAGRSDAAQTLAEAGSPNPKKQILPALIKLTRDAVALNRVEAAKALTFKGSDYTKVGEHFANFPQSVDERAFELDLMDKSERDALVKKMINQYKANPSDKAANKFLDSLKISQQLGFYE